MPERLIIIYYNVKRKKASLNFEVFYVAYIFKLTHYRGLRIKIRYGLFPGAGILCSLFPGRISQ